MTDKKWICNKCGFETREAPDHKNATCQNCGRGRFKTWILCDCGEWFHSDRATRDYCSNECKYKYRPKDGKKGKNYPHLQRARVAVCPVYCSKECWSKRSSEERTCKNCGRIFKTQKSANKIYCSQKCRDFAYRERTGELSNFWQGGKTKEMDLLRTSAEYRDWRLAVFTRDKFKCQKCGKTGRDLEAHHIKEKCNYPELIFDVNNGLTLCHECHKETDNYGNKAKANA